MHLQIDPETHLVSPSLMEFRKSRLVGIVGVFMALFSSNSAEIKFLAVNYTIILNAMIEELYCVNANSTPHAYNYMYALT